ncbi:hypothetical protein AD998_09525 [bacterium 336/3]|nr:hypothetical protein AD998_09525 [bacterium 336/3]
MKLLFYILIILVCVACASPKSDTKESFVKTKDSIPLKDTVKQAQEETPKTVKLLSGKQLLDSLLKKAKYRDLKKIEIPKGYGYGFWSEDKNNERKLSLNLCEELGVLESYQVFIADIHVYAYLGKYFDKHLFIILRRGGDGVSASDLWMVNSLGKIISIQKDLACYFADMGIFDISYTVRENDSLFITQNLCTHKIPVKEDTLLLSKTYFYIRKDSFFVKRVDTLAYKELKF